jgi:5-methylcytosine-specific restriction endonuclease McrA
VPKRHIPPALRRSVRERAHGRCEYCLIHDEDALFPHEADHVVAEKHGGVATGDNLAWACAVCNRYKGTDLTSVDPATQRLTPLYNPRQQRWNRHFRLRDTYIEPLTASGRATAQLLHFNDRSRLDERAALIVVGRYPRS